MNSSSIVASLPTADLAAAKAFYTDKVGLKVAMEIPEAGVVNFGDGANQLGVYVSYTGGKAPGTFTQVTFVVPDVPAAVSELQSKGVVFEEYDMPQLKTENAVATNPDGSKAAWFRDPDGNMLAVVQEPA
jgi:catechol 2,3-dioxygenase-like lactoylglutathione lyase family enzyme